MDHELRLKSNFYFIINIIIIIIRIVIIILKRDFETSAETVTGTNLQKKPMEIEEVNKLSGRKRNDNLRRTTPKKNTIQQ